ncbi:MAG: hypothetical protein DIZ80_09435 [endosymbiont of Galathealinum brachiosum]|uniref:Methyltransferase type 11 domain-containing protein n=1 Tax=endosymbiont of Galathealinum brachiosum TaxID=2200906 RepID=A0A370DC69_9GAMM|nr:MAG: hypothetical protein DIZ80_09435 [endosymbiont of Galathealinum brachiosum]
MSIRSYFMAKFYDSSMKKIEEQSFSKWRRELLSGIKGDVLEIGSGTGINLSHYPGSISSLVLTEPDAHMHKLLKKAVIDSGRNDIKTNDSSASQLNFQDGEFDAVVSTLVLCSVESPEQALKEIKRVLKPDGKLYFLEHVVASDAPGLIKWQRFFQPFWKSMCGNCHLTRDTEAEINNVGFKFELIERVNSIGGPPIVTPTIKGVASKKAGS